MSVFSGWVFLVIPDSMVTLDILSRILKYTSICYRKCITRVLVFPQIGGMIRAILL